MFRLSRFAVVTAWRCGELSGTSTSSRLRAISGSSGDQVKPPSFDIILEQAKSPGFDILYHTFPGSIQPEAVSDYRKFETSLAEAIAEDMEPGPDSVDSYDRITEASLSLRRVRRALERVEKRRAEGADVGLSTSLFPTRDLTGSAAVPGELDSETGVAWKETPGFPPHVP